MFRPAAPSDLDAIARIYEEILAAEDARPVSYTNWQRGKYPTRDTAHRALEAGELWVAEEEGVLSGCVILNGAQLPEYAHIPWSIPAAPGQVGVIHTLVIRPSQSGRGRARAFVAFCEEEFRRQGKTVVRLDTYEGNVPANAMYPKLGYRLAGATMFFFQGFIHEVLNCYEKALVPPESL